MDKSIFELPLLKLSNKDEIERQSCKLKSNNNIYNMLNSLPVISMILNQKKQIVFRINII